MPVRQRRKLRPCGQFTSMQRGGLHCAPAPILQIAGTTTLLGRSVAGTLVALSKDAMNDVVTNTAPSAKHQPHARVLRQSGLVYATDAEPGFRRQRERNGFQCQGFPHLGRHPAHRPEALSETGFADDDAQTKARIVAAIAQVAQRLGNTPGICRACYMHPAVLDAYSEHALKLPRSSSPRARVSGRRLSLQERALQRLLTRYERRSARERLIKSLAGRH